MTGRDLQTFMDNLNAIPPVTTLEADRAHVFSIPVQLRGLMVLVNGDCIVLMGLIHKENLAVLRRKKINGKPKIRLGPGMREA